MPPPPLHLPSEKGEDHDAPFPPPTVWDGDPLGWQKRATARAKEKAKKERAAQMAEIVPGREVVVSFGGRRSRWGTVEAVEDRVIRIRLAYARGVVSIPRFVMRGPKKKEE